MNYCMYPRRRRSHLSCYRIFPVTSKSIYYYVAAVKKKVVTLFPQSIKMKFSNFNTQSKFLFLADCFSVGVYFHGLKNQTFADHRENLQNSCKFDPKTGETATPT